MPDTISEDLLGDTFAQFRTDARPEIQPPGADTTRRTVHRRRTARFAGTTVLAITAVVGLGIGLVTMTGTGPDRPVPGTSVAPTLNPDELRALSVQALADLGYAPTAEPPSSPADLLPLRVGVFAAAVDGDLASSLFEVGTADDPLPPGQYTLQTACVGSGHLTVAWSWTDGTRGGGTMECGGVNSIPFTAAEAGMIDITVTPDDAATGRAGMAVAVTDPRAVAARNLLGEQPHTLFAGDGVLVTKRTDTDETAHEIATYRLSVACVGTGGTVAVEFALGGAGDEATLKCPTAGAKTTLTVRPTEAGGPISVVIDPKGTTLGTAAVAYWVEKL
jgi:hypothetical protein